MPTPLTDADKVLRNDTGKDIVDKLDGIARALGYGTLAENVVYDNTESSLEAENVQNAIDELSDSVDTIEEDSIIEKSITNTSIASFSDGGNNIPVKSLIVNIYAVQSGSGTPSPDNVRSISGWQNVNVVRCGKNILDVSIANRNYTSPYTYVRFGGTSASPVDGSLYLAKGTYTFSISTTAYVIRALDKNNESIAVTNNGTELTFTLTESQKCMINVAISGDVQVSDFTYQLELNDEATTYEAYQGITVTIALGQTVYGGYLDVTSGLLTITHTVIDLGDLSWTYYSGATRFVANVSDIILPSTSSPIADISCEIYKTISWSQLINGSDNNSIAGLSNAFSVRDTRYTSATTFKNAVTDVKVLAKLITPTTVQLSSNQIATILGQNNIYADTGDIRELIYFTNNSDNLVDLIQNTSEAQYTQFDNTTYPELDKDVQTTINKIYSVVKDCKVESSASGSIATFDTDLTENLVKCIANIQAVQSGSGTPSPSNVRAISGHSNCAVTRTGTNILSSDIYQANANSLIIGGTDLTYPYYLTANTSYTYVIDVSKICIPTYKETNSTAISLSTSTVGRNVYQFTPTVSGYYRFNLFNSYGFSASDVSSFAVYKTSEFLDITIPLGQTVYGGYLDVTSGVLTITQKGVDLGSLSWLYSSGSFYANVSDAITPIATGDVNAICSCYERTNPTSSTTGLPDLTFCISDGNITTQKRIFVRDDSYNSDTNAFTTGVTGQTVVYTLATPTTVQLSSNQIATILGQNNIYADTGDIEVKYLETVGNKIEG